MSMFNYIWKAHKLYIYYTLLQVKPLKYQFMFLCISEKEYLNGRGK